MDYRLYVSGIIHYNGIKDRQGLLRVYQQLGAEPEALLIKRPKALQKLTLWGLILQQPDTAEKFYRLHQQYHGNDAKFESQAGDAFE